MTNTNMDIVTSTAATLADKSDRYVMMFMFGLLVLGGYFVIRYLTKVNERLTGKLEVIATEGQKTQIELARVLERNTEALNRVLKA